MDIASDSAAAGWCAWFNMAVFKYEPEMSYPLASQSMATSYRMHTLVRSLFQLNKQV